MTTGQSLFGGLALVAAAILIVGLAEQSRAAGPGGWQISAFSNTSSNGAYAINTETGAVKVCSNRSCTPVGN